MKFKTAKEGKIWCDIADQLPIRVEIAVARYCEKARKTRDPRLQALGVALWNLQKQFGNGVKSAMEEIHNREEEFMVK